MYFPASLISFTLVHGQSPLSLPISVSMPASEMVKVRTLVFARRYIQRRRSKKVPIIQTSAPRKSLIVRVRENAPLLESQTNPGHAETTRTTVKILGDRGNTKRNVRRISNRVSAYLIVKGILNHCKASPSAANDNLRPTRHLRARRRSLFAHRSAAADLHLQTRGCGHLDHAANGQPDH